MESGERLGIGVAHSVEAAGGGNEEIRTKPARVTVVCLNYAGEPSECGERPILPVGGDGVAVKCQG